MDFSFTEEQNMLRQSLQSFLVDSYSFATRRQSSMSELGWRPEIWQAFAEQLGILSMTFPERVGGLAAGPVDTMVVMEELGRALVLEPYLETVVLCGGLLNAVGGEVADQALARIGAGEQLMALAWAEAGSRFDFSRIATQASRRGDGWSLNGAKSVVIAGPWANSFIIAARSGGTAGEEAGLSLFLVEADRPGLEAKAYPTIDGRRACDLLLHDVQLPADALLGEEGQAFALLNDIADSAVAALSAEALGVLAKLQEDTVAYAKERKQFGQPIGSFQALQHRMVDMYMQVEMVRSATYLATLTQSASPGERSRAASAAKVTVAEACRFVGQNAVQLHGGMGMTDELAISHYFKRATQIESEFGNVDYHLMRHARLSRSATA